MTPSLDCNVEEVGTRRRGDAESRKDAPRRHGEKGRSQRREEISCARSRATHFYSVPSLLLRASVVNLFSSFLPRLRGYAKATPDEEIVSIRRSFSEGGRVRPTFATRHRCAL